MLLVSRLVNAVAPIPLIPQLKKSLRLMLPKSVMLVDNYKFVAVKERTTERSESIVLD